MIKNITSEKLEKSINHFKNTPLKVGELIFVKKPALNSYLFKADEGKHELATIESLEGGIFVYQGQKRDRRPNSKIVEIKKEDIISRYETFNIGANPFDTQIESTRPVNYSFDSILFNLNILGDKREGRDGYDIEGIKISECNWNPFVYNKEGKKEYYQRDFVWSERDKQSLIESIYQGIDCGKILVRKRGCHELTKMAQAGETELAFQDLVDGKQRLNAIKEFIECKFTDMHGNYFSDLSKMAKNKFSGHQLFGYSEMPENSKDSDVIKQFLKLNFAGVPQSIEHIEFVKSINNKL